MTLRCNQCRGAVEVIGSTYPDDPDARAFERYRCVDCGLEGTYSFGGGLPDERDGCLSTRGVAP